ncbi:MAG: CPBP family glutamic-type intramembrane protease, partial [Candidatus ainarchaeum sp.]|nr:CPBP family glutamic-type intramembrane protease [Candidatus ainarchaeum sp.]
VFAEEFFFRAFLVKKIGILFSTIIFTFFHLGYESLTQTIGVFFLGLILAYWFKKNNSIIQNYFGHLIYNLIAIILYVII